MGREQVRRQLLRRQAVFALSRFAFSQVAAGRLRGDGSGGLHQRPDTGLLGAGGAGGLPRATVSSLAHGVLRRTHLLEDVRGGRKGDEAATGSWASSTARTPLDCCARRPRRRFGHEGSPGRRRRGGAGDCGRRTSRRSGATTRRFKGTIFGGRTPLAVAGCGSGREKVPDREDFDQLLSRYAPELDRDVWLKRILESPQFKDDPDELYSDCTKALDNIPAWRVQSLEQLLGGSNGRA